MNCGSSNSSAEISETSESRLICTICQEERRYLKQIPCSHAFCETCLQLVINSREENAFPCPMCRASTSVPQGGASGFETYFEIKPPPSDAVTTSPLNLFGDGSAELCQACQDDAAKYVCLGCNISVCTSCETDHEKERGDHILVVVRSKNRDLERTLEVVNSTKCHKHGRVQLQFYCHTCREPICDQCRVLSPHSRHTVNELSVSSVEARKSLHITRKKVASGVRLLETVLSDIQRRRAELQREKTQTEQEIRAKAEEACRLIQVHKAEALNELNDVANALDQRYILEAQSVQDKLSGLSAVHDHLHKVLQGGTNVDLIRTWVSAEDGVRRTSYLKKFTSQLPVDVFHMQFEQPSATWPSDTVCRFIGFPKKVHEQREMPVVQVTPLFFLDTGIPEVEVCSLCPVATSSHERGVWVSYGGKKKVNFVSFFSEAGERMTQRGEPDRVGLVSVGGQCKWEKLIDMVFSKQTLRAYIKCQEHNNEIVAEVPEITELADLSKQSGFPISSKRPLAMDANQNGTMFAVLDEDLRVYVYRRGESLPFCSYPPENNRSAVGLISDVCFYRLAGREVLLLADKRWDDVHVLDVRRTCRLIRGLTAGTAPDRPLAEGTALNVDPDTGLLWVACRSGRIVTCGDTGVQVESGFRRTLARLKIK